MEAEATRTSDKSTPARRSRSVGNLVGALAIHLFSLLWGGFVAGYTAAVSVSAEDADLAFLVALGVVTVIWLALTVLVVRWWLRGRPELWNVTLAWLTLTYVVPSIWLLPLLFWPRFRRWLGGSLRRWPPREPAPADHPL